MINKLQTEMEGMCSPYGEKSPNKLVETVEEKRDIHMWLLGGHLPNETYGCSTSRDMSMDLYDALVFKLVFP